MNSSYDVLKPLAGDGKHAWVSQVKNVFVINRFSDVWILQGVGKFDMLIIIITRCIVHTSPHYN